jgi:hypothetical protein
MKYQTTTLTPTGCTSPKLHKQLTQMFQRVNQRSEARKRPDSDKNWSWSQHNSK